MYPLYCYLKFIAMLYLLFNLSFSKQFYSLNYAMVTLLLLGFLSQNVTVKSVLSFDFTCSGKSKSLFRTGVSLHLWHLTYF